MGIHQAVGFVIDMASLKLYSHLHLQLSFCLHLREPYYGTLEIFEVLSGLGENDDLALWVMDFAATNLAPPFSSTNQLRVL